MHRIKFEISLIAVLWKREVLRFFKEKSRWIGVALQPLFFWLILGSGLNSLVQNNTQGSVDYARYFFPGILFMIVLFTALFSTMSVIEDRQSGFLQNVLVTPGSRFSMILGKIAGIFSLILIQSLLFLIVAPYAGYSWAGIDWILLFVSLLLTTVFLASINFAMAWLLPSVQAYHALMSTVLIPLWILSGAMFPAPTQGLLAAVVRWNPMSPWVFSLRAALSSGDQEGFHRVDIGYSWSIEILLVIVALFLCTRIVYRYEVGK